jgi:hypothetical protein
VYLLLRMDRTMSKSPQYALADFKDPFAVDMIERVNISSYRFMGKIHHTGVVEFKNGNTGGKQDFKGESFADVGRQIQLFIDGLEKT